MSRGGEEATPRPLTPPAGNSVRLPGGKTDAPAWASASWPWRFFTFCNPRRQREILPKKLCDRGGAFTGKGARRALGVQAGGGGLLTEYELLSLCPIPQTTKTRLPAGRLGRLGPDCFFGHEEFSWKPWGFLREVTRLPGG